MKLIHIGLLAGTLAFTFQLITGSTELVAFNWNEVLTIKGMSISLAYLIIAIAFGDFIHYLQHKILFLWNFHKVHHSCHPDHLDKNFAFMFPVWDVLFKTYHMPEDDRDVKFGLYGVEETEYTSIWKIYTLPFDDLWCKHVGVAGPAKEASKD